MGGGTVPAGTLAEQPSSGCDAARASAGAGQDECQGLRWKSLATGYSSRCRPAWSSWMVEGASVRCRAASVAGSSEVARYQIRLAPLAKESTLAGGGVAVNRKATRGAAGQNSPRLASALMP